MTHSMRLGLLLVCLVVWGGAFAQAQDSALLDPLKQQWENIRRNVVGTAEVVPEDLYGFRPTPEVRTLSEQLIHIIEENYFFMGMVSGEREQPPGNLQTKAQIIQALSDSYDYGAQVLDGLNDSTAMETVPLMGNRQGPRWSAALMNIADNQNHYGNLVVYMRMNGIVPPSSRPRGQ